MTAATNDLNRIIRDATIVIPQCMMLVDEIVKLINRVGDYDVIKLKSNVKNFKKLTNVISDYYEALQEIIEGIVVKSKPDMMSKLVETFIKNDPTNVTGTENAIKMTGYQLLDSTAQILFTIQKMISSLIDIVDGKKSKFLTNARKFKKVKKLFSNSLDMIFEVINIINEKILKLSLKNLKTFDFKTFKQLEDIISGLNKIMVNLLLITPLMLIVILISPAIILSLLVFVLILNAIFKIISLVKPKTVLEVSKGIQSINLILLQIGLLILELLLLAFLMPIVLKASLTVILGIIIIGLILTIMFSVIWLLGELIVKLNAYKNMITVLLLMVLMIAVVASFLILALLLFITQQIAAKLDVLVILLFLGGILLLTVAVLAIGYLAISVGAYLMPAVAGVLLLVVSIGIIVAAVLVIALMLYVLQFLELDQDKIAENISKVIGSAMLVISSIFAPKEEEEGGGESKSWFASVIEMVGGAILTILQAILAVYFLALTLVAISLILFMAFELRLLQEINLDTNAINTNVHIVIDTAKMVINALFEPQDDKEDAEPKSWFMSVIEMVGGTALMIIKALLSIFILALSIVAIALIIFLSAQLRLLQEINLDQKAIFKNIDIVISTAKKVIGALFEPQDEKEDAESKSWFMSVLEMVGGTYLMIMQAILAIFILALSIIAIALILFLSTQLRLLQEIELDQKAIFKNIDIVISTAKKVIGALFEPQDEKEDAESKSWFISVLEMVGGTYLMIMKAILSIFILALSIIAIALILFLSTQLRLLQEINLDQKAIFKNIDIVISTAKKVISALFEPQDEKEDAESKSWFISVLEMVGGTYLMIMKAILSIFILALSIVAIALILFLSTQLRLLQNIELDQNAIFENIDIVISTAKRVVNSLFDSKDDKEDQPSNKNFFLTLMEFFCQPFAMIFGAIMSIGFLALTVVSIALILMIATELQSLQKIKLDSNKIRDVVSNVINTAKLVINSIMKPDDSKPKRAKGIFKKILRMVLPSGLLDMIDAMMAIGFLALAKASVGLVGDIAVHLTTILKLPSMKGIGNKVDSIIDAARSIINRIINNGDGINKKTAKKLGEACDSIEYMISTMKKIGNLSNTVNSLKPIDVNLASQTQKSFDIVISLLDSITMKSKSDINKTQRKLNQLSEMQIIIQKFNNVTPADIKNSEAMLKNYSNFLDKVDNSNLEGLKTTTNLIGKMAELSKSINGDFQGLADALNEKIAPLLEELKKSLEEIKELTQRSETTTSGNGSVENTQSTKAEPEKKKEQSQTLTNSINDVSSKLSELIDMFENGDARVRTA